MGAAFTAFRLFGDFIWPPVPHTDNETIGETKRGVVEICFFRENGKLIACLRWVPKKSITTDPPVSVPLPDDIAEINDWSRLFELTDAEIREHLDDGESEVGFQLRGAWNGSGERLRFRGAFLLDQFVLDEEQSTDPPQQSPDLRIPLLRRFTEDEVLFSELAVGREKIDGSKREPYYRLYVAAPSLWRHRPTQQGNYVAFFATYRTILDATALGKQPKCAAFKLGSRKNHHNGKGNPPELENFYLGGFDICRKADSEAKTFFQTGPSLPDEAGVWADSTTLLSLLSDLGFRIRTRPVEAIKPYQSKSSLQQIYFRDLQKQLLRLRIGVQEPTAGFDAGDLSGRNERFELQCGPGIGQLRLGSEFFIDLTLSRRKPIESGEIWGLGDFKHELHGQVALTFNSKAALVERLLKRATSFQEARRALKVLTPADPQSALPNFEHARFSHGGSSEERAFALHLEVTADLEPKSGLIKWSTRENRFALSLAENERLISANNVKLPALFGDRGFDVRLEHDPGAWSCVEGESRIRFLISSAGHGPAAEASLGGFHFTRSATSPLLVSGAKNFLRVSAALDEEKRPTAGESADINLSFAFDSVEVVAPDMPRGDRSRRRRPLLIRSPHDPHNRATDGRYLLNVREWLGNSEDWRLTADLGERVDENEEPQSSVLLSTEPFSIARIVTQPIDARGDSGTIKVATYDSDTRQWLLKQVSPTYRYVLPPQAIGESMDKPGRLEIHDAADIGEVIAPMPAENDDGRKRHVVDYRLTPPTDLWIRPSDVERAYFAPEWAMHEIFRQRGELGLGAALDALRSEFLYGLAVSVTPAREQGPARRARVAEIEALTGKPVGKGRDEPNQEHVHALALRDRWTKISYAIARRPERLEIWADDPDSDVAFAPARFKKSARFALRKTALHRRPTDDAAPNQDDQIRTSEHGLSGGALWPIESANILNSLLKAPASSGGEIEKIALSPLGGDADQKSEFLNGKVAIVSETRGGRIQRQKFEVIGRIAVFWHRAKHVVLYERSVSPSAQFAGAGGETRRPVLRKISEYIEILETERFYPDFPTSARSTGFLKSVRFNSRIIPVDSSWGEEVGAFGWKVPLWNRHAAVERPQVYRRPDIAFVTAAEGDGDEPLTAQECLNPDNIYFFADAQAADGDTDRWPPRLTIDCANLPAPSHAWQRGRNEAYGDGDTPQASAPRIPRGHSRFTWRLAPPSQRSAVNAQRGESPLYAGLDSITFMRAETGREIPSAKDLLDFVSEPDNASEPHFNEYWKFGHIPDQSTDVKTVADALNQLFLELPEDQLPRQNELGALRDALVTAIRALKDGDSADGAGSFKSQLKRAKDNGERIRKLKPGALKDEILAAPKQCERWAANAAAFLRRKKLLLLHEVQRFESSASTFVTDDLVQKTKEKITEELANEIERYINPAFAEAEELVGDVAVNIQKARAALYDLKAQVDVDLDAAVRDIGAVLASYDREKPWSEGRAKELESQLSGVVRRLQADGESAIGEARYRLNTELDDAGQEIASFVAKALPMGLGAIDAAKISLNAYGSAWAAALEKADAIFTQLRTKLEAVSQEHQEKIKPVVDLVKSAADAAAAAKNVAGVLEITEVPDDQLLAHFAAKLDAVSAVVARWIREIRDLTDRLAAELGDELASSLNAAAGSLNELLVETAKYGARLDNLASLLASRLRGVVKAFHEALGDAFKMIDVVGEDLQTSFEEIREQLSSTTLLATVLRPKVIKPAAASIVRLLPENFDSRGAEDKKALLRDVLLNTSDTLEPLFNALDAGTVPSERLKAVCKRISGDIARVHDYFNNALDAIDQEIDRIAGAIGAKVQQIIDEGDLTLDKYRALYKSVRGLDHEIRKLGNDLARSKEVAEAYGDRVLEGVANLSKGGALGVPNNILKLYAAVGSAPELPNLDYTRKKIAYYYDALNDVIDTTPVEAWFGRLGDELKALGLSLPFNKIGDRLIPDDLSNFDIGRIFKNLGGAKLANLFEGHKLPKSAKDAIRVTHDFDKKQARAWVQIDIDLFMASRKALFKVGPFKMDLVNSRLKAFVRLEASKDTDKVEQSGDSSITTDLEAVVSGQKMVGFRQVAVRFDKGSGLKVDFDPKKIELNKVMQFVQNTLGTLFPDEVGGQRVIKSNGVPVGLAHDFSMPPISLMFGTSGVSNIQIANTFELVAFPDFVISDRFSLAKPELPFLFTVFIIGGTGWLALEAQYRPFDKELTVIVDGAAGGSASIGFAFSGVTGSVMFTVSLALNYRKVRGRSGALTVSLVVLVAGNVDVLGIVHVYIGVLLRLSYLESGDINADGTLQLRIRISRFFKLKVRRNVRYKLKGKGKSSSQPPPAPPAPPAPALGDLHAAARIPASTAQSVTDARIARFLGSLR